MSTHYSYTFNTVPVNGTSKKFKVLIRDTSYDGEDETILRPDDDGFTLSWDGAQSETYQPFITSTFTAGLYIDDNVRQFIGDLIKSNEVRFTVQIYEITLSTPAPKWQGIVMREEVTVPDSQDSIVTITATDGFGLLKDSQYEYTSGNSRTILDYLAEISLLLKHDKALTDTEPCWRLASAWFEDSCNTEDDPLGTIQIDEAAFAEVDEYGVTQTKSYYEILEQYLLAFNLQISQWNGVFMLVQQNSYEDTFLDVKYWDYAYDGSFVNVDKFILLDDTPARFEGGSYSYIMPAKEVTTEYEFKRGILNDNLLPYNVDPDNEFNVGMFEASDYLHIGGTIETTYEGDTGADPDVIYAKFNIIVSNGSYYLTNAGGSYEWLAYPVYVTLYSSQIIANTASVILLDTFNITTPVIPDDTADVTFEWTLVDLVYGYDLTTAYTSDISHSVDDVEGTFNIRVNAASSGQGKYKFQTTIANDALTVVELQNVVIGDGPSLYSAGAIAVDVSGTYENSDLWQIYGLTGGTNYPLNSLRCLEMLALRRYAVPLYSGNFFGQPNIHKCVEFSEYEGATEQWIWTAISWNANLMEFTGTLMQIKTSRASVTVETPLLDQSKTSVLGGGSGGSTPVSSEYVPYTGATGDVDLGDNALTAAAFYITPEWRVIVSGSDLVFEKYISSSWVKKQTISG